eukprot:SAG22_NODE_1367_length_4592_cov_15.327436_4_plen_73_part_00
MSTIDTLQSGQRGAELMSSCFWQCEWIACPQLRMVAESSDECLPRHHTRYLFQTLGKQRTQNSSQQCNGPLT